VDDRRVGRLLRSVRQHLDLRQVDVGNRAGVSQKVVSDLELGRLEAVGLARTRRVAAVLDVSIGIDAWWRGGQADRLLDRAHAGLVDYVVGVLGASGWQVVPEFTFNHYGDRGSVDILAWHPGECILLIVEVKATLTDLQDMLGSLSKKVRVVPKIAAGELGWRIDHVAKLLVVGGSAGNRSVVSRHAAIFEAAFPARSRATRAWLRRPRGAISAIWLISASALGTGRAVTRARVRLSSAP